jgi:hypothetical protein
VWNTVHWPAHTRGRPAREFPAGHAEVGKIALVIRSNWNHGFRRVVLTDTEFGLAAQPRPRSEVGSVVSAVFAPEMRQHVFVLDRQDRLLLRLRGGEYSPDAMNRLVDALDVPVTDFPDIVARPQPGHVPVMRGLLTDQDGFVTPAEFDEKHPGLLEERDFAPYGESRALTGFFRVGAVLVVIVFALIVVAMLAL